MKNITVSVPDEVYHAARVKAAEGQTTVSSIVRTVLEGVAAGKSDFQIQLDIQNQLTQRLRASGHALKSSENLTREQLHERDALR